MYRGTTPVLEIHVDTEMDFGDIERLWLIFKTSTREVTRELDTLTLNNEEKTITCTLTQEETLKFANNSVVEVQLRGLNRGGVAWASDIGSVNADRILKDGEI